MKLSVSCVKVISIACAKEDEQDVNVEKAKLLLEIVIWSEETVWNERFVFVYKSFFVTLAAKVVALYLTAVRLLWNLNYSV